jgi:hypothetical protein
MLQKSSKFMQIEDLIFYMDACDAKQSGIHRMELAYEWFHSELVNRLGSEEAIQQYRTYLLLKS